MFRTFPIFERLISWTKPEAPQPHGSREYELYDHNSLVAEEEGCQACVASLMDRSYDVPSRAEMEAGLALFVERAGLRVRYQCRWESTQVDGDVFVLETSDGEYRCRAVVFAIGVTTPWTAPIPGLEHAAHYVDVKRAKEYDGRSVFIVGKRNSAFEIANSLLPWAKRIVLASPRAIRTDVLGHSPLRTRYLQPLDEHVRGGFGTSIVDASIERVERMADGFRVHARGTSWDGPLVFDCDDVIAATGFRAPLQDLPRLGVDTVSDGRIPAQTMFWESVSVPGIYFAGNATLGSPGSAQAGPLVELGLGERLSLQRAHPHPPPGGEALRRRAAASARRAGPTRPPPAPRARDRARALDPEGLPLQDRQPRRGRPARRRDPAAPGLRRRARPRRLRDRGRDGGGRDDLPVGVRPGAEPRHRASPVAAPAQRLRNGGAPPRAL